MTGSYICPCTMYDEVTTTLFLFTVNQNNKFKRTSELNLIYSKISIYISV